MGRTAIERRHRGALKTAGAYHQDERILQFAVRGYKTTAKDCSQGNEVTRIARAIAGCAPLC